AEDRRAGEFFKGGRGIFARRDWSCSKRIIGRVLRRHHWGDSSKSGNFCDTSNWPTGSPIRRSEMDRDDRGQSRKGRPNVHGLKRFASSYIKIPPLTLTLKD